MKKTIILLLLVALCLPLTACNLRTSEDTSTNIETKENADIANTNAPPIVENDSDQSTIQSQDTAQYVEEKTRPSKEDLLAIAEEVKAADIQKDSVENMARAKQKYCNKTLLLSGCVSNIEEDHIVLSASASGDMYIIDVYLSIDELVSLEKHQYVTVVGTTTDEIIDKTENIAYYSFNYRHYQMPEAYYVKNTLERTGYLVRWDVNNTTYFYIKSSKTSSIQNLILFSESVDTSALEHGQEIKISAKCVWDTDDQKWRYYDAVIIE